MNEVQLVARYTVKEGKQDELFDLLSRLAEATRKEPGNRSFRIYRELGSPRGVLLLERYASREALAAHRATPHFRDLVLGRIVGLLDERVLEEYEVADTHQERPAPLPRTPASHPPLTNRPPGEPRSRLHSGKAAPR